MRLLHQQVNYILVAEYKRNFNFSSAGIARGSITVGFHVGNCKLNVPCDAYTSYNAISRIIIEEVEPGQ